MALQVKTGGEFTCPIRSHRDTDVSVESNSGDFDKTEDACNMEYDAADIFCDLASWLYDQLHAEYDYQNSDECVDESIEANEYEFDEDGDRA
jgi:hypothetical protein